MKQFDLEKYENFIVIAEDGDNVMAAINVNDLRQLACAIGGCMFQDNRFAELIVGVAEAYKAAERKYNLEDLNNSKN